VITQPPFDHLLIVARILLNLSGAFLHIALGFCKIVVGHFDAAPNPPNPGGQGNRTVSSPPWLWGVNASGTVSLGY
jgi:hypothetical protein